MSADDLTPDELASAYLDGEATATERALVEADPQLLARVEQMRAVAQQVAAPVAPAPRAATDGAIAAALAAASPYPVVTSLETRRARWYRSPAVLGVAAAVVAAIAAVPLLSRLGDGSEDPDTATASESTEEAGDDRDAAESEATALDESADAATDDAASVPEAIDGSAEEASDDTAGDGGATGGESVQTFVLPSGETILVFDDLGPLPSSEALRDQVRADLGLPGREGDEQATEEEAAEEATEEATESATEEATEEPTQEPVEEGFPFDDEAPECLVEALALAGDRALLATATATVAGQPVVVYVLDGSGAAGVLIFSSTDCGLV